MISVCLIDTTGEDDIHINDTLTEEGHADFTSNKRGASPPVPIRPMPSVSETVEPPPSPQKKVATVEAVPRVAESRSTVNISFFSLFGPQK